MNYEEKYKEALERAKKFEEKYGGDYAGYIFPELAESEGERIRKELKEAFEAYDIESTWNGIPIRSIFAWLEKQKEQKPWEWSEEDEKYLNRVINLWVNDFGEDSDTVKWLKSLRPSWKPSEDELAKKHLEGYYMGREDTLREMKDFIESHFNCENAKKGTPIVYNTQSGTSTLKAEG